MTDESPEQVGPKVFIDQAQMGGVWSNFARVSHSAYEFTIDFVRLDFAQVPPEGIVVSRVSVSPLMVSQLIEALDQNWKMYAEKAMPPEVYSHEDSDGGDGDTTTPPSP